MSALERCECGDERFCHLMSKPQPCVRVGCGCKAFTAKDEVSK
jgi:hypothetical protein